MATDYTRKQNSGPSYDKTQLCKTMWDRYEYMRDYGHEQYLFHADHAGRMWYGDQWDSKVTAKLKAQGRPYLTMNMLLNTTDTIVGEQINNRNETRFRPRYGKDAEQTADALNKVYKHISQGNNLTWLRTDVYEDGLITGRGFYEVRIDFTDNLFGEVRVTRLDPKVVMLDPDAVDYDPETWNDVGITRWLTPDDIETVYGKKYADKLRSLQYNPYSSTGLDSQDDLRDRVATAYEMQGKVLDDNTDQSRYIRVFERQYRTIVKRQFFANLEHGDLRPVPDDWDDTRIEEYLMANPSVAIIEKLAKRVRWTVVACNEVLFDEWSPYEFFTVVPFFAHFRNGRSVGVVEQLFSAQELLNKTLSQELHVVNTTANSGWKVKKGALTNMTPQELETRGAETGLVIELDSIDNIDKIQPNQIPSGIDRLAQTAQAYLKTLGVSDYMRGEAREDVSARALEANQAQGKSGLARMHDNLIRSDVFLARAILACVQQFYVEERVLYITGGEGRDNEQMVINQVTPEGQIVNDLTIGEYNITVDSANAAESLQDSEFEQALALRKEGIAIPDAVLIRSSRLMNKQEIIDEMDAAAQDPMTQRMREAEVAQAEAEVKKTQADALRLEADADNKASQAQQKKVDATQQALSIDEMTPEQGRVIIEKDRLEMDKTKALAEIDIREREMALKERELLLQEKQLDLQREQMRLDAVTARMQARATAKADKKPQTGE